MAFQFDKASCIVVGTFNMYIFHRQWLLQREIIDEGTEIGIETNLTQPGFRFRLPKFQATLHVAPTQLFVESLDPGFDCGEVVAKALAKLPETPVFALGNNASYKADPSELENLAPAIRGFPRAECPSPGQSLVQRTFHTAVNSGENRTINVQLILKDDSVDLACNVHNDLQNREGAGLALAAARRFFDDRAEAKTVAQHYFGASIDDDSNHS